MIKKGKLYKSQFYYCLYLNKELTGINKIYNPCIPFFTLTDVLEFEDYFYTKIFVDESVGYLAWLKTDEYFLKGIEEC